MGYEDCERANAAEMTLDETREVMGEQLVNERQKVEAMGKIAQLFTKCWLLAADYKRDTIEYPDLMAEGGLVSMKPSKRITVTLVLEEEG